jgi:hypothetical protein
VAGANLQDFPVFRYQMPDERREFHKIRPASHTLLSVNCLYQMNAAERKGVFTKLGQAARCYDQIDFKQLHLSLFALTERADGRDSVCTA